MKQLLLVCLVSGVLSQQLNAYAEPEVVVQVKSAALRAEPNHWARTMKNLIFGEKVAAGEVKDGWMAVTLRGGTKGYLHQTAIGDSKVVLRSLGDGVTAVGSNEVALAGKGFGEATERALSNEGGYDFLAVSRLEKVRISDGELAGFRKSGRLS